MKRQYSIGETAKLLGVTTQTLRYYEKIGILGPRFVEKKTGYRYYTFNQFHRIDRIKYLQHLGLPLSEISKVMKKGTVDGLLPVLEDEWKKSQSELMRAQEQVKDIEWYIDYFTYLNKIQPSSKLYRKQHSLRHILYVPCYENDELADMEIRLAETKSCPKLHNLPYRRQYGYEISIPALFQRKFRPISYFIYLKEKPSFYTPYYKELPAGEYLCFRTQILHENWDIAPLQNFFEKPHWPVNVLALEFEGNLIEYLDAEYEVQMYWDE